MEKHIKKYMVHCDNIEKYIEKFNDDDAIYTFDTESCFVNEELKNCYENKIQITHEGNAVKVYAWAISNTVNDYVVYGETIHQFFETVNTIAYSKVDLTKISENKVKNIKSKMRLKMFVHNLGWDIEFLKYYLLSNNYNYSNSKVKNNKKVNTKNTSKSFNVVENDNVVYSSNINLQGEKVSYRKKINREFFIVNDEIFPSIELLDSYKILSFKLDSIAKNILTLDDKFHKLGDTYDYGAIRPEEHKLTELEKTYLYNDVYILKEFLLQFYLPLDTKCTTASGIAFEKFIVGKFGDDKPYKSFLEYYPDLSNRDKIMNIIKSSYRGGWTQANFKYKGEHLKNINGTSIDINSSYPAVIRNKPLPYGEPILHSGYNKCGNNELNLLVIEFDKFYNKNDDNFIGEIQVGAMNSKIFNRLGTDYLNTNFIDGKLYGTNALSDDKRYRLYIWEFELNNILENTVFENYEVVETLTFKCNTGFFGEVVDNFTLMKIEGKKQGNKVKEQFSKLVLNSFYGKMASNIKRVERKIILDNKGLVKNEKTDIEYITDKKYYPAFASAVTAWARVNLRTILYKVGYNNVLYFDTDSLYTLLPKEQLENLLGRYANRDKDGNIINIINDDNILDKYELGKWDIEKTYTEFKTIGSKKYMLKTTKGDTICKCAGVPEVLRNELDFKDFYIGNTFEGKLVKTKLRGGYALIEGNYQLREISFGG